MLQNWVYFFSPPKIITLQNHGKINFMMQFTTANFIIDRYLKEYIARINLYMWKMEGCFNVASKATYCTFS